jgi:hypothetical protein
MTLLSGLGQVARPICRKLILSPVGWRFADRARLPAMKEIGFAACRTFIRSPVD